MNLNGVEYYYIRNAQGDIIGLIDDAGTEVVTYSYDSWGKLISIDGSLKDTVGTRTLTDIEAIGMILRQDYIIYKAGTIILNGVDL